MGMQDATTHRVGIHGRPRNERGWRSPRARRDTLVQRGAIVSAGVVAERAEAMQLLPEANRPQINRVIRSSISP